MSSKIHVEDDYAEVGDALVHGKAPDQLLGIEIGFYQRIIALHLPMPGFDEF